VENGGYVKFCVGGIFRFYINVVPNFYTTILMGKIFTKILKTFFHDICP